MRCVAMCIGISCVLTGPIAAQAPKKPNPQQMVQAAKALTQFGCQLHFDDKAPGTPVDLIWFPPKTNNVELARLIGHALHLPQLKMIDLGETGVTSAGLKELARLPNLESVYLDKTAVNDAGIEQLAKIERLAWLDLSGTKVTAKSVEALSRMKALRHLFLNGIKLAESDVSNLANLSNLRSLGISAAPDETLKELSRLTELRDLNVKSLGKIGVEQLSKINSLETYRQFGGLAAIDAGGWKMLAGQQNLTTLDLGNFARDDWPAYGKWLQAKASFKAERRGKFPVLPAAAESLGELTGLKQLDLTGVQIGDDVFKTIAQLTNLEALCLCSTAITLDGVKDLGKLSKLRLLNARNAFITDRGLKALEPLKELKFLYLYDNPITETGVKQLQRALPKCAIYWRYTGGTSGHNLRLPGGYGG